MTIIQAPTKLLRSDSEYGCSRKAATTTNAAAANFAPANIKKIRELRGNRNCCAKQLARSCFEGWVGCNEKEKRNKDKA